MGKERGSHKDERVDKCSFILLAYAVLPRSRHIYVL